MISKRAIGGLVGLILLVGVVVGGISVVRERESTRLRDLLNLARQDVEAQRYGTATQRLMQIDASRPEWFEVPYLLALCEISRGREAEAIALLSRIPEGCEFAGKAAVQAARREMFRGKFTQAEARLLASLNRNDPDADDVRRTLVG